MAEIAVNVPLDSGEIKDIIGQELRKRLDGLSPLHGAKEYASFEASFQVKVTLRRVGDSSPVTTTLAWGAAEGGQKSPGQSEETVDVDAGFKSGDPNEERMTRGMPLTVETTDGRGNKTRKKVVVK